MRVTNKS